MASDAQARTPDEIRRSIERTREELAETAAALAERADVKARAHEKLDATKARFTHKAQDAKAKVTGTAGAAKGKAADATPTSVATGAGHVVQSTHAKVRDHPIPTAAVAGFAGGVLLGWLIASRR